MRTVTSLLSTLVSALQLLAWLFSALQLFAISQETLLRDGPCPCRRRSHAPLRAERRPLDFRTTSAFARMSDNAAR